MKGDIQMENPLTIFNLFNHDENFKSVSIDYDETHAELRY